MIIMMILMIIIILTTRLFEAGRCWLSDACSNAHGPEELRKKGCIVYMCMCVYIYIEIERDR